MSVTTACYHCGLPVAAGRTFFALVDGRRQAVCCPGCQAVAEAIADSGLSSYYRTRTAFAPPPEAQGPREVAQLQIYDRPEVQTEFVRALGPHERETTLILDGITCAACVWLNQQQLSRLPGVLAADANYATRRALVRWDDSRIKLSAILAEVQALGYRAWPATSAAAEQARKRETREALWRLFVAGFGMMQVMMYAVPAYLADAGTMSDDIRLLMRLASLVLTVPVIAYSSAPFFRGAWRDLMTRRVGMNTPIALGLGAAFGASVWATFAGGAEVYYDSVTMFVFFLLCARYLEMRARQKAAASLDYLDKALPLGAHRLIDFARGLDAEDVPAVSLRVGDLVLVRAGEAFPGDGLVVQGETECDESLLTGESAAVHKGPGSIVTGGAFNRVGPVIVRVERIGDDTRVSGIRRLVESASMQRPQIAQTSDRIASWFVAGVLLVAVASAIAWIHLDAARALWVAVSVLVVSCPCALSLATPVAVTVAVSTLARRGVVVVKAHAIETMAAVTHVVFDKTGTLTEGRLGLANVLLSHGAESEHALAVAAALERTSEHPIAAALIAAARDATDLAASALRNTPGAGIEGIVAGVRYRLGTQRFVAEIAGAPPAMDTARGGVTRVWLGSATAWVACFELSDQLRSESAAVVRRLRASGKRVLIWSGDAMPAVETVAHRVGADGCEAGLLPEDKLRLMRRLQADGAVVAMVGDGVNDAPVLAQAQLSVAMGTGALLSQAHADVVLLSGRLQGLLDGLELARRTRVLIVQNLSWAIVYNVVALPLAAAGMVTPWLAGVGMGVSSLVVVLNALRLGTAAREPRASSAGPAVDPAAPEVAPLASGV